MNSVDLKATTSISKLASGGPPPVGTRNSRKVAAAYAEGAAPFTKDIEGQFALRHDRYSTVGSTINLKLGWRWNASKEALVRASYGTGFRAPSFSELYRPRILGTASSVLPDPVLCRIENNNLIKRNQGKQNTSGVDLNIDWRGTTTDIGRFGAKLNGTVVLESKKQTAPGAFAVEAARREARHTCAGRVGICLTAPGEEAGRL